MFLEEMVFVCEGADVGTGDTDLFASSKAVLPAGDGPITTIRELPGAPSLRTHDTAGDAYEQPRAQLKVRAKNFRTARDTAWKAYRAFRALENTTVLGTPYLGMRLEQIPSDMGTDSQGRAQVGFTFSAIKRPSDD